MWSIIRFKPFSFNIENYEKWLEQKSEQGLILTKKIKGIHIFKREKSERVRYFLDINDFVVDLYKNNKILNQTQIEKEILNYEDLYKECGWELVYKKNTGHYADTNLLNIHLWRKSYISEKPTALTDNNSLIKFYRKAIYINFCLGMSLVWFFMCFIHPFIKSLSSCNEIFWEFSGILSLTAGTLLRLFFAIFTLYSLICSMKYYLKYKSLKRQAIYKC